MKLRQVLFGWLGSSNMEGLSEANFEAPSVVT